MSFIFFFVSRKYAKAKFRVSGGRCFRRQIVGKIAYVKTARTKCVYRLNKMRTSFKRKAFLFLRNAHFVFVLL